MDLLKVTGANEHNLKGISVTIEKPSLTVVTGVSGSGKTSLVYSTLLNESFRRFFGTLSHYSRQFLTLGPRPQVKAIEGLPPALSLSQREALPRPSVSVGELVGLYDLLHILWLKFAQKNCPTHQRPTDPPPLGVEAEDFLREYDSQLVLIAAPLGTKGQKLLKEAQKKGFKRLVVDGQLVQGQDEAFEGAKISLCIDLIKIKPTARERLERSLEWALTFGNGRGEVWLMKDATTPDPEKVSLISNRPGCPVCGFRWPALDARSFQGKGVLCCEECEGSGLSLKDESGSLCSFCAGSGLGPSIEGLRFGGKDFAQLVRMNFSELDVFIKAHFSKDQALQRVLKELHRVVAQLLRMGLTYLTPQRKVRSLSVGEHQRVRLGAILGEPLNGMLYILDEPSQGLSKKEVQKILALLQDLRDQGNTVLVVDHDETLMRGADWLIDLGPGGGRFGGEVRGVFPPKDAARYQHLSKTAEFLASPPPPPPQKPPLGEKTSFLTWQRPRRYNLKMDAVKIPLHHLTLITGPSGAGKSTLLSIIEETLLGQEGPALEGMESLLPLKVLRMNRAPFPAGSSMVGTYLEVFTPIRELFAKLEEAQVYGIEKKDLSLSSAGGRCEECKGRGSLTLKMRFLQDAEIPCPRCLGKRFSETVLLLTYQGKNLSEILSMTIGEALEFFAHHRTIEKKLRFVHKLGLGYLSLGQPMHTLSGGESQRMRLSPLFLKGTRDPRVLILDEPTIGLHPSDVEKLIECLESLRDSHTTVLMIDHDPALKRACDWVVELGPGGGEQGGALIAMGPPF